MGVKKEAYRILVRKAEGKRLTRKWDDNIKMNPKETEWGYVD
jgi:hypothetical protein